ncbi:MAG: phosphatase PAP2 family protein [Oscillospiraceae bacterium]|nr:phosphatase PAP2 family protein [Oscillospiraceae bacterium]
MDFLYLLESIRFPALDQLMLLVTHLGEETAFLVIALIVFWCVDKYHGYYMLGVGLLGNLLNQFMKITCRIPRPWVRDPDFTVVEAAKAEAGGYSFPSGHTQTAVGTFGAVAATQKRKWLSAVCVVLAVLTAFSRMYLGVHTPADVLVGGAMALALVFGLKPLMLGKNKRLIPWVFGIMLLLSAGFLAYLELYPFPADVDADNYASAVKNAYTFLGCFAGVLVVYAADETKLRFTTKAVWWVQILKAVLGLGVVLLVKEGLRSPLEAFFGGHMAARAVRYFLIVVTAGIIWPLGFRLFSKLGDKKERVS